jgi:hypothetical protein
MNALRDRARNPQNQPYRLPGPPCHESRPPHKEGGHSCPPASGMPLIRPSHLNAKRRQIVAGTTCSSPWWGQSVPTFRVAAHSSFRPSTPSAAQVLRFFRGEITHPFPFFLLFPSTFDVKRSMFDVLSLFLFHRPPTTATSSFSSLQRSMLSVRCSMFIMRSTFDVQSPVQRTDHAHRSHSFRHVRINLGGLHVGMS